MGRRLSSCSVQRSSSEPSLASRAAARSALKSLIQQFSGEYDFVRELVQNALDSRTAVVRVWTEFESAAGKNPSSQGVAAIHVEDDGSGMDRHIIENELTRLFASSKAIDLTCIGKFGVGFVSVFAVKPRAVIVTTGKNAEHWQLYIHADQRFDLNALDGRRQGTQVTVLVDTTPREYGRLVEEVHAQLEYWCRHAHQSVLFSDRGGHLPAPKSQAAGARVRVRSSEQWHRIDRPFAVDGDFHVAAQEGETKIAMTFSRRPRYGFYNRGLTLLETDNIKLLEPARDFFQFISFKVESPLLEHTISRDSIARDENFRVVLKRLITVARDQLVARLVDELESLAGSPELEDADCTRYLRGMSFLLALPPALDPNFSHSEAWNDFKSRARARLGMLLDDTAASETWLRSHSVDAREARLFRHIGSSSAHTLSEVLNTVKGNGGQIFPADPRHPQVQRLAKHAPCMFALPNDFRVAEFFALRLPAPPRGGPNCVCGQARLTAAEVPDLALLPPDIASYIAAISTHAESLSAGLFSLSGLDLAPAHFGIDATQPQRPLFGWQHNRHVVEPIHSPAERWATCVVAYDIEHPRFLQLARLHAKRPEMALAQFFARVSITCIGEQPSQIGRRTERLVEAQLR